MFETKHNHQIRQQQSIQSRTYCELCNKHTEQTHKHKQSERATRKSNKYFHSTKSKFTSQNEGFNLTAKAFRSNSSTLWYDNNNKQLHEDYVKKNKKRLVQHSGNVNKVTNDPKMSPSNFPECCSMATLTQKRKFTLTHTYDKLKT